MSRIEFAKAWLELMVLDKDASGDPTSFDNCISMIYDVQAWDAKVSCSLPIVPRVMNRYNTLHGGCMALVTKTDRAHVSVSISTDYMSPMPGGGDCLVEAEVVKVGKLLATINVTLKDKATGRLCAQGRHIKFIQQEPFSKGKTPKALLSKM